MFIDIIAVILIGWVVLTNIICTVAIMRDKTVDGNFSHKWAEEVETAQDTRVGRIFMKTYYFVPTIISAITR